VANASGAPRPRKRRRTLRKRMACPGRPRKVPGRVPRTGRKGRVAAAPVLRGLERGEPECNDAHGRRRNPPAQKPRRAAAAGLPVGRRCRRRSRAPVADSPGPRCTDLLKRTLHGLTWTLMDGLCNLFHAVPGEGPRIRTGASCGPSKRYCRVFGGVSLTRQTLSRLADAPVAGAAGEAGRVMLAGRRLRAAGGSAFTGPRPGRRCDPLVPGHPQRVPRRSGGAKRSHRRWITPSHSPGNVKV
jgi:hypothetical protein